MNFNVGYSTLDDVAPHQIYWLGSDPWPRIALNPSLLHWPNLNGMVSNGCRQFPS